MNKYNEIGKKSTNLQKLEKFGFNVPKFIVISESTLLNLKDNNKLYKAICNFYKSKIGSNLPKYVSIRTSGSVSAPGRMTTLLNVPTKEEDLVKAFREVQESTKSVRLKKYLETKGVKEFTYSIIVQEMVYGNFNEISCSGVLITTNPYDLESEYYTEVLINSLGSDLMDGKKTPVNLKELKKINPISKEKLDVLVWEIQKLFSKDQEVEFVIQGSQLYVLQSRDYSPSNKVVINDNKILKYIGQGRAVTKISTSGVVTFKKNLTANNKILITQMTDFEDTESILNFAGVITLKGGLLSHAAMIANDFNLPCIVGTRFEIEPKEGDKILFDENGTVFLVD